jgi:hypothetical protein
VETLAELPFTGDQVGLFRAQPGWQAGICPVSALRSTTGSTKRSRCPLQPAMTPVPITFFRPQNRDAVIQALPAAS